jgi:putative alpha-1,2-mannosidase
LQSVFLVRLLNSVITNAGGDNRTVGSLNFSDKVIIAKVGISSVSVENALENLDSSLPGWDFDATREAASDAWEKELSKIRIKTDDQDQKTIFLYSQCIILWSPRHCFQIMNGEFKGVKGDVQNARRLQKIYSILSLGYIPCIASPVYPDSATKCE